MPLILGLFLIVATAGAIAQQYNTDSGAPIPPGTVEHPSSETVSSDTATLTSADAASLPDAPSHTAQQKSGTTPGLPTSRQFLGLAAPNGVATTSLIFAGGGPAAAGSGGPHQPLDGSSGRNCAGDSAEKTNGNKWITSLVSIASKNQHYCALGEGGLWRRGTFAMSRAFAAHQYDGANSFNTSNLFAAGIAPGVPAGHNAYQYDAGSRLATRYATAVGRDALKNMFREFWPDVSAHVLRRHP
jgi:hypothetical protein